MSQLPLKLVESRKKPGSWRIIVKARTLKLTPPPGSKTNVLLFFPSRRRRVHGLLFPQSFPKIEWFDNEKNQKKLITRRETWENSSKSKEPDRLSLGDLLIFQLRVIKGFCVWPSRIFASKKGAGVLLLNYRIFAVETRGGEKKFSFFSSTGMRTHVRK